MLRTIIVCVEFDDLLRITLPRNRRHFSDLLVVTAPQDKLTTVAYCAQSDVDCRITDAFYRDGCHFNKGLAIEESLDELGRDGWICVCDADVVLPETADFSGIKPGTIYGATRRILEQPAWWREYEYPATWRQLPVAIDKYDWFDKPVSFGGHFVVFHAQDPVLATPPWFPTHWIHAGGYDSDFIAKWPAKRQRRLPFEVLHLGLPGQNWYGRVTSRIDRRPFAISKFYIQQRVEAMNQMRANRERYGGYVKEMLE